jgi:Flp pilus assembly protein TadD
MKDIKQSLLYANKALLINKDYAYAHYRKAWALQETGKFGEASDGYSKAIELNPTDVYNYLGMACVSLNNNDSSEALEYANKALFVDRNCGGAYYYKSIALSNLGRQKEAEKAFAKALKLGYTSG